MSPALLVRTPYPATSLDIFNGFAKALFDKNYAIIMQNERGSQWSEGDFGLLTKTTADGQDTLDWIAAQAWSNGRVGMHGCSSTAENQLKLAAIGHPALRGCVAMSSGAGIGDIPGAEGSQGLFFRGGVPMLADWALWHVPNGIRSRPKLPEVADGDELARTMRLYSLGVPSFRDAEYAKALAASLRQAPSGEVLRRMGAPLNGFEQFIASPTARRLGRRRPDRRQSHRGDADRSTSTAGWTSGPTRPSSSSSSSSITRTSTWSWPRPGTAG